MTPEWHIYRAIRDGVIVVEIRVPSGTSHSDAWKAVMEVT